ncbi:MAG: LOG family protein [Candidatus Scalinduaceae bacterium]
MDPHYRIAIFGSARIKEGGKEYNDVYLIARGLAESRFDIVTGGGPGIMQAANAGHKSAHTDTHSMGLTIKLPFEQEANKYLDIKKEFDRFSNRLDTFMSLSDAVVVATGGIGTLLELFYSWQLSQVQHICETPIVLYGDMWAGLIEWLRTEVLARSLFDSKDMHNIFHITSVERVVNFIRKVHEDRLRVEHVCVNYDKYRVELEKIKK